MASVSSLGIGSGLDLNGILTKLMQVEQQPLTNLNTKEASYQMKISALGSLQAAVSTFNSSLSALQLASSQTATQKFSTYKASIADSSIASATATSSAVAGSYSLEVTQLATTHRISTLSSVAQQQTSGVYAATDEVTASGGTLNITVNGTTTGVTIGPNATLADIETAINQADAGVTASLQDSGTDKILVLTSNTSGTNGTFTVVNPDGNLAGFVSGLTQTQAARGYSSSSATIATGTLNLTLGDGTSHDIVIDSTNNTLAGLRDAINAADAGVTATLSTVSSNDVRLIITSNTIGNNGKINLSGLSGFTFDATSGTGNLSQAEADGGKAAQGSIIKVNNVTITGDSNNIENAIEGVTLNLTKVTTDATTLTVTQDKTSSLSAAFTSMVKAYNDLNTTIHNLSSYDADTQAAGPLLGNSTLRTVSSSIRNVMQSVFGLSGSSYKYISDLGVAVQKDGSLTFDSSKLTTAVGKDFASVAKIAAGFGSAMKKLTDGMLGTSGTITAATDGIKASIKGIDKQREVIAARLVQIEANYRRQFTALDTLVASMNQTSTYLTQQLASLPGVSSSS